MENSEDYKLLYNYYLQQALKALSHLQVEEMINGYCKQNNIYLV